VERWLAASSCSRERPRSTPPTYADGVARFFGSALLPGAQDVSNPLVPNVRSPIRSTLKRMSAPHSRAAFSSFEESTAEDWAIISPQLNVTHSFVPDRVMALLRDLKNDHGGFPVDRLEHSLQTATRAERDGRDEEYVLCALIHDIGDTLSPFNHPAVAAAILQPFVSSENHWMVEHHGIFQGYYFWHHIGLDRNAR